MTTHAQESKDGPLKDSAYETPKFVEDLVRDVTRRLIADPQLGYFSIAAENFESIHNHSAYAAVERPVSPLNTARRVNPTIPEDC